VREGCRLRRARRSEERVTGGPWASSPSGYGVSREARQGVVAALRARGAKPSPHGPPGLSFPDPVNRPLTDAVGVRELTRPNSLPPRPPDLPNLLLRQLRNRTPLAPGGHKPRLPRMPKVLLGGHDFEIFHIVVALVSILMIDLHPI